MTHLFKTLLANGFGVDLHLENHGICLANETPHFAKNCIQTFRKHTPFYLLDGRISDGRLLTGRDEAKRGEARRGNEKRENEKCTVHTKLSTRDDFFLSGFAAGRRPVLPGTLLIITDLKRVLVHSCHRVLAHDLVDRQRARVPASRTRLIGFHFSVQNGTRTDRSRCQD